jgi:hypothetical protein
MLLNLQNFFIDRECMHYSLNWQTAFPDINGIFWKSGMYFSRLLLFKRVLCQSEKIYQPLGGGGLNFAIFKRVLQIQKVPVLSG